MRGADRAENHANLATLSLLYESQLTIISVLRLAALVGGRHWSSDPLAARAEDPSDAVFGRLARAGVHPRGRAGG